MPKKTNESRPPQNALNKFMCRILFEKKQLERAYNLDGKTVNISRVKPPRGTRKKSDDVGGLVDSHLENMYHSLYGEPFNLRKLLIDAKAEIVKAGIEFKLILNPLLNAMFQVHESCIEDLRIGKGWNEEAHCNAFDGLNQELGAYSERIIQITTNSVDKPIEPKPTAKKKKRQNSDSIKINQIILKNKNLPDKALALLTSKKMGFNVTSDMIRNRKSRLRQKGEM